MEELSTRASCGACSVCCKLLGVEGKVTTTSTPYELKKPRSQWCEFVQIGKVGSCKVYEDRPQSCQDFECLYIQLGNLSEEYRPDNLRVMFWEPLHSNHYQVELDIAYPNAYKQPKAMMLIEILLKEKPILIVVGKDGPRTLIPGPHEVKYPIPTP